MQILDPFNKLFDAGHTSLAQLKAQAEQLDEALGGAEARVALAARLQDDKPSLRDLRACGIAAIGGVRVNISDDSL